MQTAAIVPTNTQQRMTLLHTNSLTNDEESDLIGFQNSKFSRKEIEYKISRLAHVHLALEHLLQIQVHLNLENGKIEGFSSVSSPSSYDTDPIFIFPLLPLQSMIAYISSS